MTMLESQWSTWRIFNVTKSSTPDQTGDKRPFSPLRHIPFCGDEKGVGGSSQLPPPAGEDAFECNALVGKSIGRGMEQDCWERGMMKPVDEAKVPPDRSGHLITNGAGAVVKENSL